MFTHMATKLPTTGGTQRMKQMMIVIPEDLHRLMKSEAAKAGLTVKQYVTDAIRSAVKKGGEKK
jgi:predicted HicB family RNase H-like nuclease